MKNSELFYARQRRLKNHVRDTITNMRKLADQLGLDWEDVLSESDYHFDVEEMYNKQKRRQS